MLAGVNPLPIKEDFDARLDLLCENINKDYVNWSNGRASSYHAVGCGFNPP